MTTRSYGGGDGELTAMEVRSISKVLDHVVGGYKVFHSDPEGALVTHCGNSDDVASSTGLAKHHHRVAADSRTNNRAFGDNRR